MLPALLPLVGSLVGGFVKKKGKGLGIPEGVGEAFNEYLTKDQKALEQINGFVENARKHDIATFDKTDKFSNRLRSSVRPLTTFAAMAWYIYARLNDIPLNAEDYAIIGGVMAFWFGFRPFEKAKK